MKKSIAFMATTALGLALPAIASAELAVTDKDSSDIILVTAQKREQNLVDVPLSIRVVGAEELERRGIDSVHDLSFAVPGVTLRYDGPGSIQIFMRGVGNLAGADALVSVYMDETPVTLNGAFRQLDLRSLDIERVEVLKGPQGTLYGQGATAGTVRFVTRNPNLYEFEGDVEAQLAFIDQGEAQTKLTGIVGGPIAEGALAFRIAATMENGGGWIDQPEAGISNGNNQDLYNIRGKLLWQPADGISLLATAVTYRNKSMFGLDYEEPDRTNNVGGGDPARVLRPRNDRYELYNLTASADVGDIKITSSTSYINLRRDYSLSYIAGPETVYGVQNEGYDFIDDRSRQFTQEARVSSNNNGKFNYTIGAFYRNSKSKFYDDGVNVYDGIEYPYIYISNTTGESWSVFADTSYDLTDRLQVGAGIRYFEDKVSESDGVVAYRGKFDSTDPRFYASYKIQDNLNLFASVAKGFRSGGVNRGNLPPFGPEKAWNYEIGVKGAGFGGLASFELAGFYTDFSDQLRRGIFYDAGSGGGVLTNLTSNIGKVEIKGVEGAIAFEPVDNLVLSGSAAYIDSKVKAVDLEPGESIAVRVGDRSDYVPRFSFTVALDYGFEWSENVDGFFHIDFNYRDKVHYTDDFLYLPQHRVQSSDSIGLLGARIGAKFGQVRAEIFATNLTNENRLVDPFGVWSQANRTKPRTIGVKVGMGF